MVSTGCVFCKIIAGVLPSTIIAENSDVFVIKDIAPKAPIHYLIIPKKHIVSIQTLESHDVPIMGSIVLMAKELSSRLIGSSDFRLIENDGPNAGQSVFHLHMHFLSGQKMTDF